MKILILSDFLPNDKLTLSEKFNRLFHDADAIVFNLEGSPLLPAKEENVASQLMPFEVAKLIAFLNNFDKDKFYLSLANNHILDNGLKGFDYLVNELEQNNIAYFGTKNKPCTEIGDVAVLSLVTAETVANIYTGKARLNYLFYRTQKINRQIKMLEAGGSKLIFYPHWGRDMDTTVFKTYVRKLKFQKDWMTFGHHPHIISGVKKNQIYSMGNSYIPHPYYFNIYPATHYGLAILLDSTAMQYELLTTKLTKENTHFVLDADKFSGINDIIIQHGKNYSTLKKIFLKTFAFKGSALDVIKLSSLQLMRFVFALKYKFSKK